MPDLSMTFKSPLPDGTLIPTSFQGDEQISRPFRYSVTLVTAKGSVATTALLRQAVCVTVRREKSASRHFHGIIRSITRAEEIGSVHNRYEAEIVPQMWFASQTIDCRVFHHLTTSDIVKKVLEENGVTPTLQMTATLPNRSFTVQYNESDLDFISRLMEEDGMFYFFEHSESGHEMVITDNNQAFRATGGASMAIGSGLGGIRSWKRSRVSSIREVTLRGYNARQVSDVVGSERTADDAQGGSGRDITHWYGRSSVVAVTKGRARFQQEAADVNAALSAGSGENAAFFAGGRFKLAPVAGSKGAATADEFVINNISHFCSVGSGSGTDAGAAQYSNQFVCFRASDTYRTLATTPRPNMGGIHLAVVLGPSGEEIFVNNEGRIKVRFLWDHRKDATEENTIFVRVMQPWSGNHFGMQHIPRVGTEVAVAFINGDPDDPVVVGSLYNGTHQHPFQLPNDKTKSGIRTRSSPTGGGGDYNEFFLDDKKGQELVSLHAQKDHRVVVENDQNSHVMRHLIEKVDVNRTREVGADEKLEVKGTQTETVTKDRTVEISQGNDSLAVKMGNITIKADLGKITVEAMQSIELKVGGNSVKIDQSGVTINGLMVKIEAKTMMGVKGLMTNVEGSAMTTVKGGLIMIN